MQGRLTAREDMRSMGKTFGLKGTEVVFAGYAKETIRLKIEIKNTSMKIEHYTDEESWLVARMGRVTGTRLKDLVSKSSTEHKKGFWEIVAERIAIPASDENRMDRGHRLEDDALERFAAETGKKVINDLVIWSRDDDANIAISPDGYVKAKSITEAIETKSLNSASHIEAWVTKKIPKEYEYQVLQYFVTCDTLKTLYFCFYDPRLPKIDFFYITVTRKEVQEDVDVYLELERKALAEIAKIERDLTF